MWIKLPGVGIVCAALLTGCSTPDNQITEVSDVPFSHVITPITRTFRGSVGTTTDAASFATGSYTPAADRILIATVQNTKASSPSAVNTFTGNGLTWNLIQTVVDNGNIRRITQYWAATGASPTTGAATADFGGVTQTSAHIRVDEFDGLDLTNPIGDTDIKNPSGSHTSLALALTFAGASNGTYAAVGYNGSGASTPTAANITQMSAVAINTPSTWLMTGWDAGNQTAPGWSTGLSWTWWGAGFEMIAATPVHPAELPGMTQRTHNTHAATNEASWVPREGAPKQTIQLTTDGASPLVLLGSGTAPVSPPEVLQSGYGPNQEAGSGPIQTIRTWAADGMGDDTVYLHIRVQLSTNFHLGYAGMSGTSKIGWLELDSGNQLVYGLQGFRYNTPQFRISLQNCVKDPSNLSTTNGSAGDFGINLGALARGQWHEIEILAIKNTQDPTTTGNWDGVLQVWLNRTLVLDRDDVGYVGTNTASGQPLSAKWNQIKFNPTWTGGYADTTDSHLPGGTNIWKDSLAGAYAPFYMWWDDTYVSGK
jgi:hypothetical protein